jgi:choloylglycine hydrolase
MPGFAVVNKRGVRRQGLSFEWLYGGTEDPHPQVEWVSKYGSVTFNYNGVGFPDGGMNEAGLVFQEMTLLETSYPTSESRANLFMTLWIQQVLDTCATVDEVISSARSVALDGWSWHFFAADASGSSAVIEFLDGEPVIYTGETLPYPVVCNSPYAEELDRLGQFERFGGTTPLSSPIDEIDSRFARGADLLARYEPSPGIPATVYAWSMLDAMSPGYTQSAQVYDISNRVVEFRTFRAARIRSLRLDAFDFGCTEPIMVLDLNDNDQRGEVTDEFVPYTVVLNSRLASESLLQFSEHAELSSFMEATGVTVESLVARHVEYPGTMVCEESATTATPDE